MSCKSLTHDLFMATNRFHLINFILLHICPQPPDLMLTLNFVPLVVSSSNSCKRRAFTTVPIYSLPPKLGCILVLIKINFYKGPHASQSTKKTLCLSLRGHEGAYPSIIDVSYVLYALIQFMGFAAISYLLGFFWLDTRTQNLVQFRFCFMFSLPLCFVL
jgi:hypothetical protein